MAGCVRWKIPICSRGPAGSISSSVALFGFLDDITLGDGNNARFDRGVRRRVTATPGMDVICRENDRVIVRPASDAFCIVSPCIVALISIESRPSLRET